MPLTIEEVRDLLMAKNSTTHSLVVGKAYFIRTATLYYTGRLVSVTDSDLVLSDAAWIACTGRFYDLLRDGTNSGLEVEPYPNGTIVNRAMIVDVTEWTHDLPRKQK